MKKMKKKYCDDYRMQVTPLHHLVARCSTDMVVSFLRSDNHYINSCDSAGQTPLYYAIFRGYRYGLNLLLQRGANVNMKDYDENTPLHLAVKRGNVSIVSDLLIKGADLEQKNNYGQTVLQYAIVWNYSKTFEQMISILLSKGANVDVIDKDLETPLHSAAARKDSKSVCLLLLAKGANIHAKDKRGNTPLHIASMKQSTQVIVTLIDKGADIEVQNKVKDTPLHIAVRNRVPESVSLLLKHKADVNAKTENDKTALHLATQFGCDDVMKVLLDNGASLEEKDYRGNTALHCAVKKYDGERLASILLERGAAIEVLNKSEETPLELALLMNQSRCNAKAYKPILEWGTSVIFKNHFFVPKCLVSHQYDTIIEHFVKLVCARIHLDVNGFGLPMYKHLHDKVISCRRELEKMQDNRFGRHSLYDILLKYSDPIFLSNNKLKEAITSPIFESSFPVYGSLIKITLMKAEKRFQLLNQAQTCLKIPLPNEIQRKILAYLDEISLLSVIQAFQSS